MERGTHNVRKNTLRDLRYALRGRAVERSETRAVVGKRSLRAEASGVSQRGVQRSENAGTSNRNAGEIPAHRKSKVSWAMSIIPGLAGPKARPKGVVDGHTVNIP